MFTGSRPPCCRQASMALKCMKIWPLSSAAPRAYISPCRIVASNGGDSHWSSGSTGWTS